MPNTINIVQPKAEDGTEISFITRTNSIFKSDGSPLGDSMDAYMDEVDELSQNLTQLVALESFSGTTGTGANAGLLTIPKSSYPNVTMIVPCGLSDNASYSCHYWSQSATNFNIMVKSATGTSWASGVSVTFTALVYKLPSA